MIRSLLMKKLFYLNKERNNMKKLNTANKFLFILNILVALFLIFSYFLPYVSPKTFPSLAVISLSVPILISINILFFIYWLIRLKKQFFLSFLALILGFNHVTSWFLISGKKSIKNDDLKILSYNVKGFNHLGWEKNQETAQKIIDFTEKEAPDILVLQEFYVNPNIDFNFSHKYVKAKSATNKFGQVIYSKYKIINSGSLDFKQSANNIIFSDILRDLDTIRIYNIHLESLGVNPYEENFGQENSEKLYQRIKNTFSKQAYQTDTFLAHKKKWKGKTIICGDFNNTAFSWVYNEISSEKKDAFIEAGHGFGKTYNYPLPLRIDFILTDEEVTINHFQTFDIKYSDHFPIMAHLNWK